MRPPADPLQQHAVPTHLPKGWDYGRVFGALPQTGTASPRQVVTGLSLLLLTGLLWWRGGRRKGSSRTWA